MARTSIERDSRVIRSREILESAVDGEVIALDIAQGECYGFNPVASSIWHLLGSETSVAEICDSMCKEFEVERDVCEADVTRLLVELQSAGLVDVRNS
jgi:hypothetical protein